MLGELLYVLGTVAALEACTVQDENVGVMHQHRFVVLVETTEAVPELSLATHAVVVAEEEVVDLAVAVPRAVDAPRYFERILLRVLQSLRALRGSHMRVPNIGEAFGRVKDFFHGRQDGG